MVQADSGLARHRAVSLNDQGWISMRPCLLDGESPALTQSPRSLSGPATDLLCDPEQFTPLLWPSVSFSMKKIDSREPNTSFQLLPDLLD